ncbi:MAG: hypothetical protein DWQ31_09085 [Planctomycetota bacterium]|nr:MAG: hypothetical protein DWQ31_09085 [Planctomycetota bacterium]
MQLGIVRRMVFQWFVFFVTAILTLPIFRMVLTGDIDTPLSERLAVMAVDAIVLAAVFLTLMPYFAYDTLRASNRFAGPIYRLQKSIRATGFDAPFQPIRFREGDHWLDLADDYNEMVERLQPKPDVIESGDAFERDAAGAV